MRFKDNGRFNEVYGKTHLGAHLIQGQAVYLGERFFSRNPANPSDLVGIFPTARPEDLEAACQSAIQALVSWQNSGIAQREMVLANLALLLEAQHQNLVSLLTRETGKVWARSAQQLQALTAFARQGLSSDLVGLPARPAALVLSQDSLSAALPLREILQALVEGHTVIWKPWSHAPAFASTFACLLQQAGVPAGVLNLLHGGEAVQTGLNALIASGRLQAFPWPAPPAPADMTQPQWVLDDAPLEEAVSSALAAMTAVTAWSSLEAGNRPHKVVLQANIAENFKRRLLKRLQQVKIGDPNLDHGVHCGPLCHRQALNLFLAHLHWGKSEGAQLLSGQGRMSRTNKPDNFVGDPDAGYFVWPAIWEQLKPGMKLATAPVWGPSLGLYTVADRSEATALEMRLAPQTALSAAR